jgi:hypothetical protein
MLLGGAFRLDGLDGTGGFWGEGMPVFKGRPAGVAPSWGCEFASAGLGCVLSTGAGGAESNAGGGLTEAASLALS